MLNPVWLPEVAAVPAVVWSESERDICVASSSSCACACGRIWSRISRYAPSCPDWIDLLAMRSVEGVLSGETSVRVPTPSLEGSTFHSAVGAIVPRLSKTSLEACTPTSCRPEEVNTEIWLLLL